MLRRSLGAVLAGLILTAPAMATDKVTLLLDWFVNPDHAPIVLAQEQGLFDKYDLEVEIIAPADPSAPPRLVAAGQGDIAITYQPDLMLHLNEGLPLVRFGTLIETPLNALIALKDGPIKTLADLKGKKVGYSVASFHTAYLDQMLETVGLSSADVELINVNFNLVSSLLSRQVEATIDGYRNFELTQLEIEGEPGIAFYPEEHGLPSYDELIFVAHSDRRDDPILGRFLSAIEEATIYLTNHPEEARRIFMESHPDLNDKLNLVAFDLTLPRFAKRPAAIDVGRYDRFAEFLKDKGLIDEVPPVDSYAIAPR